MSFFNRLIKKRNIAKRSIDSHASCDDYLEIMVQYQGKHIVYKIQQGMIVYKNAISALDDVYHFPDGFFDPHTIELCSDARKAINKQTIAVVSRLSFVDTLDSLPPGASHEALMICTKTAGDKHYYSNCHLDKSRFSVNCAPIDAPFFELFDLLSSFCDFAEFPAFASLESRVDCPEPQDKRYFEETLWMCESCSAGNLMEHRYCIKCGKARPW